MGVASLLQLEGGCAGRDGLPWRNFQLDQWLWHRHLLVCLPHLVVSRDREDGDTNLGCFDGNQHSHGVSVSQLRNGGRFQGETVS